MSEFSRNSDILPDHAAHPGWEADGCIARLTVTPRNIEFSPGFACAATGGHCLPGANCDERRAYHKKVQAQQSLFERRRPR